MTKVLDPVRVVAITDRTLMGETPVARLGC